MKRRDFFTMMAGMGALSLLPSTLVLHFNRFYVL